MTTQYKRGDKVTVCYNVIGKTSQDGVTPVSGSDGSSYYRKFDEFDVVECVTPIRVGDLVRYNNNGGTAPALRVLGLDEDAGEAWLVRISDKDVVTKARSATSFVDRINNYKRV